MQTPTGLVSRRPRGWGDEAALQRGGAESRSWALGRGERPGLRRDAGLERERRSETSEENPNNANRGAEFEQLQLNTEEKVRGGKKRQGAKIFPKKIHQQEPVRDEQVYGTAFLHLAVGVP